MSFSIYECFGISVIELDFTSKPILIKYFQQWRLWNICIFIVLEKQIIYLTVEIKKIAFGSGFLWVLCFDKCLNFISFFWFLDL